MECFYSPVIRNSICAAGNIRVDLSKISVSRGGEEIQTVRPRRSQSL